MTLKEFRDIALHAAKGTAPETFSVNDVNAAFVDGLKELAGTYNQFMKNRYDIYDIIIESIDEVMPANVMSAIGAFAEVQQVAQGEKAMFRRKKGAQRAKKFLTQVGLSGVYETFRLDADTFEISAHAVGGGATIDFERMLDGAESLAEVVDIVTEGLTNAVFVEVQKALIAALQVMPATNKIAGSWSADNMVKLLNVVRAYGNPVIFAPPEFIAAMGPDAIVPTIASAAQGVYSPKDIEAIHDYGFVQVFRGAPIVRCLRVSLTRPTPRPMLIHVSLTFSLLVRRRLLRLFLRARLRFVTTRIRITPWKSLHGRRWVALSLPITTGLCIRIRVLKIPALRISMVSN